MTYKIVKYILCITFFLSSFWGIVKNINTIKYNTGIIFNFENFIIAILFLLSMIIIAILSKHKEILNNFFLYYWILIFIAYNIGDFFNIKFLEKLSEFLILPFYSIFPIIWNFTDGETATIISLLFAFYVIPLCMISYLSIIIFKRNRIK